MKELLQDIWFAVKLAWNAFWEYRRQRKMVRMAARAYGEEVDNLIIQQLKEGENK